ncbi:hypothetical protein [Nocardioides jishulii]|nr:hypothetical protein [Nocardioides jishulii]
MMVAHSGARAHPAPLARHLQREVAERPWPLDERSRNDFTTLVDDLLDGR